VIFRSLIIAVVVAVVGSLAPSSAIAALSSTQAGAGGLGMMGLAGGGAHSKQPMRLNADGGIEWQQDTKSYIARKNAVAVRGDVTLRADTITAYYRDAAKPGTTEIWRVIAAGNVRISTPTESVIGDTATYDLDQAVVIMTGKVIRLTTPTDIVTARDSLEWWDLKQLAVARGNATAIRGDRVLRADTLWAHVLSAVGQPTHINSVDAVGHVVVTSPGETGTADTGVYNADTAQVTLHGHVILVRGDNTLSGEYGVIDLSNGVSRLMPEAGQQPRVEGLIFPPQKGHSGDQNPR